MSAASEVIGLVTGVLGLLVGVVSLYLQVRSEARSGNRGAVPPDPPARPAGGQPPLAVPRYAPPASPPPVSGGFPSVWVMALYGALGGANYVLVALSLLDSPVRQVVSGVVALGGGTAMLFYVRHRFREWTRPLGFAFGVLGGAPLLALPFASDPPATPVAQQLAVCAVVVGVTVLVVVVDKYREGRGRQRS